MRAPEPAPGRPQVSLWVGPQESAIVIGQLVKWGSQIRVSLTDALPSAPAPINRHEAPESTRPRPAHRGRGALGDPHIGPSTGRVLGTGPGDPERRSSPALDGGLSRGMRFENPCEKLGRDSEADAGGEGADRRQDEVPRVGGLASLPVGPGSGTQCPALGPR